MDNAKIIAILGKKTNADIWEIIKPFLDENPIQYKCFNSNEELYNWQKEVKKAFIIQVLPVMNQSVFVSYKILE